MWPRNLAMRVGSGDVSLARAAARGIDRAGVARALHVALESGIELVDVSAEDDSERLAGETIRALRLRDKVITAVRVPALAAMRSGAPVRDTVIDRVPPRYVQSRIEAALRATKLDALPLAQVELRAAWRASSAWPELVGTCARLVREGKVLGWGALIDRIEDDTGELALEPWLDTLSIPLSLCERDGLAVVTRARESIHVMTSSPAAPASDVAAATGLSTEHMRTAGLSPELVILAGLPAELVLAAAASTTSPAGAEAAPPVPVRTTPPLVLARRPLAGGALAGTVGPGVRLKPRDDRQELTFAQLERIAVAATKLAAHVKHTPPVAHSCEAAKTQLEANRRPEHVEIETLAELALRFVISHGAIALPRLHRHEHVMDAIAASVLPPLPAHLMELAP